MTMRMPLHTQVIFQSHDGILSTKMNQAMRLSPVFIILLVAVMQGCAQSPDEALAEQAVVKFHAQLDANQGQQIYDQAADEMKKDESERVMVAIFAETHRKWGLLKSSKLTNTAVNYLDNGHVVTLTYKTIYANGTVHEDFRYLIKNNQALLAGYTVY